MRQSNVLQARFRGQFLGALALIFDALLLGKREIFALTRRLRRGAAVLRAQGSLLPPLLP